MCGQCAGDLPRRYREGLDLQAQKPTIDTFGKDDSPGLLRGDDILKNLPSDKPAVAAGQAFVGVQAQCVQRVVVIIGLRQPCRPVRHSSQLLLPWRSRSDQAIGPIPTLGDMVRKASKNSSV